MNEMVEFIMKNDDLVEELQRSGMLSFVKGRLP